HLSGVPKSLCKSHGGDLQAVLLRFPETRFMRQPRVAVGQLHAIDALPALRNAQADLVSALPGKPLREKIRLLDVERDQDFRRNEEIVLVVTLHDLAEEVARLIVRDFFPEQLAAIDDISITN